VTVLYDFISILKGQDNITVEYPLIHTSS